MATKLEKAQRDLDAVQALENNAVFTRVFGMLLKDQDGTMEQLAARDVDSHDRAWFAGYLVGLSVLGGRIEKIREEAQKIVNDNREHAGG